MTKTSKIVKTILLSAILIGVTFTLSNIQSAYAQPPLFGLAHTAGPSTLYTINTSTGVATPVGPVGFNRCSGMDFDASGTLFAACNRSSDGINVLITINTSTGAGIEIGTTGSEAFQTAGRFGIISDISFRNSDGVLFGYGGPDGPLFTINTATGAVTQVGPFPTSPVESGNALAFSATDTLFYMEIDPPVLNTLNPSTGAKTVLGSISIGCCSGTNHRVNAADFDPNSGVLFGSLNVGLGGNRAIDLVTITTTPTFVATIIGITVDGLDAIAFQSETNQPPEITAPNDVTAECNEDGGATGVDLGEPTVSDNEDAEGDLVVENDAAEPFSLGPTTVNWQVTDTGGLTDSDTQEVTVEDTTDPLIDVPADIMVFANTNGGWSGDIGNAQAADICDSDVDISNDELVVFPLGDTTVVWCAIDDSENETCDDQIINVKRFILDIDIKPASDPNSINVKSNGVVPVAILGSIDIDVTLIDVTSLAFGPSGATPAHDLTDAVIYSSHLEDVPVIDGLVDLVSHYKQKQTGLSSGDTEACITGLYDGIPFEGCDAVNIK